MNRCCVPKNCRLSATPAWGGFDPHIMGAAHGSAISTGHSLINVIASVQYGEVFDTSVDEVGRALSEVPNAGNNYLAKVDYIIIFNRQSIISGLLIEKRLIDLEYSAS